jgi:hypothetical protein
MFHIGITKYQLLIMGLVTVLDDTSLSFDDVGDFLAVVDEFARCLDGGKTPSRRSFRPTNRNPTTDSMFDVRRQPLSAAVDFLVDKVPKMLRAGIDAQPVQRRALVETNQELHTVRSKLADARKTEQALREQLLTLQSTVDALEKLNADVETRVTELEKKDPDEPVVIERSARPMHRRFWRKVKKVARRLVPFRACFGMKTE